jgi:hypothetical protein
VIFGDYPNIRGNWTYVNAYNIEATASGAASFANMQANLISATTEGTSPSGLVVTASEANAVYSDSIDTVQPAGLYGLYLVRAYQA